jgi:hypothetical protein
MYRKTEPTDTFLSMAIWLACVTLWSYGALKFLQWVYSLLPQSL